MPPHRIPSPSVASILHPPRHCRSRSRSLLQPRTLRPFAAATSAAKGAQNSRPGWTGRQGDPNHKHGDDHAVNRDGLDAQSKEAQAGLQKRREAELKNGGEAGQQQQQADPHHDSSHGQGVSRVDEGKSNKKAKDEFPEAPEPVIGMNSERGRKGHS